jgi:hypothetical protein
MYSSVYLSALSLHFPFKTHSTEWFWQSCGEANPVLTRGQRWSAPPLTKPRDPEDAEPMPMSRALTRHRVSRITMKEDNGEGPTQNAFERET